MPRPMPEPQCVLVLAPNWLGDAVMALPAVADIRRAFPAARLVVAARGPVADLFRLTTTVDDVVTLRWSGRWWRRVSLAADADAVRAIGADVAILLPNSFAAAWLVSRANVPERWGYGTDLRSSLLTRAIRRPAGSLHQGAYYQHLTRTFDIEPGPLEPALVVSDAIVASARAVLSARGWDGRSPLIVLAPGAVYGTAKRWLPAYVAQLIAELTAARGATCVLVGSRGDRPTARMIASSLAAPARARLIDLTGETTLEQLAGTLRAAQACVSNDSGAMHVAAAIGAPLVALFGPTRERETAPLTAGGGRAEVLTHPVWCRPCMLRECPIDHRCMTGITPGRVFASVERLMTA
jgi:heptosyltransferase-2